MSRQVAESCEGDFRPFPEGSISVFWLVGKSFESATNDKKLWCFYQIWRFLESNLLIEVIAQGGGLSPLTS